MAIVGQQTPEWSQAAYVRGEQQTISSKDYKGKWHVLYWYPLDFTFVCPTEIVGFQSALGDLEDDSVSVIGVSTDSFFSHNAWFADKSIFPESITHPVLADTNHSVSKAFGVLKEDAGVAYRATVVVDDKRIVRSVAINDLQVGRSPAEVVRTVQAFQSGGLCGANWKKGDKFVG